MISGIVAIIGRPNVGKSTLFNRLTTSDDAIVDDRPGVTRDRLYGTVWLDSDRTDGYVVIDTGGFEKDDFKFQPFAENLVWRQTDAAIQEADLVVLLVDAKAGINPHDRELAQYLNRLGKHHMVVVNKVDGLEQAQLIWDFYELSEDPLKVSAAHNRGVADLREDIGAALAALPGRASYKHASDATRIAIVGRPNAGKSSILNRLTGEERALVSDIAGTTRDAIDTPITYNNRPYVLVDTAGIRRKSRIFERIESLSVVRSIRAIERADVVLLVMDARDGLTEQDMRLAQLAAERWKPIILVINKWDLVENKTSNSGKEWTDAIHHMLKTLSFAPIAFVSCIENQRVHKLMQLVEDLSLNSRRRIETHLVNQALRKMVQEHTPALIKGKTKRVKFYFATQVAVEPPTIVVFCNVAREIHESYIRYMTRRFQEFLGFNDIPLRVIYRAKTDTKARPGSSATDDVDVQETDVTEVEAHVYEGDELASEGFGLESEDDLDRDD